MLLRVLFVLAFAIFGKSSFAQEFSFHCFAPVECKNLFSDIVTDKFLKKFPNSRFKIVVIGEFQPYSDGGGVGYAIAGVSPKERTTQVPIHRFSVTQDVPAGKQINGYEATKKLEELVRVAITQMMAACDRSSDCAIYVPQK